MLPAPPERGPAGAARPAAVAANASPRGQATRHTLDFRPPHTRKRCTIASPIAGGERREGTFVFRHDPRRGELTLGIASYGRP